MLPTCNRVLHQWNAADAVHQEANDAYQNDKVKFKRKVNECVRRSREAVYDPPSASDDPHAIVLVNFEITIN